MFGDHHVETLGTEEAFGRFNGRMLGKTIIFIDETLVDPTDANNMMRKVGNKTIDVNVKYGLQGSFDNTAWYWLGGNGTNGAVMLAGDTTDRRYSVLTVSKSVMPWVGRHLGIDVEQRVLPGDHPCVKWYTENVWKLENASHVAAWLDSVVSRWGNQPHGPTALHDEDYTSVRKAQKSVFEDVMESVFHDPAFKYIKGETLYDVFKLRTAKDSPAGRSVKNKMNFLQDVDRWLQSDGLSVEYVPRNYVHKESGKRTSGMFYVDTAKVKKLLVPDNSGEYTHVDDRGNVTLVDRGLPHVQVPPDQEQLVAELLGGESA